jgi:hypothetical protein
VGLKGSFARSKYKTCFCLYDLQIPLNRNVSFLQKTRNRDCDRTNCPRIKAECPNVHRVRFHSGERIGLLVVDRFGTGKVVVDRWSRSPAMRHGLIAQALLSVVCARTCFREIDHGDDAPDGRFVLLHGGRIPQERRRTGSDWRINVTNRYVFQPPSTTRAMLPLCRPTGSPPIELAAKLAACLASGRSG